MHFEPGILRPEYWLASISDEPGALTFHMDTKIRLVQMIGIFGVIGILVAVYNAVVTARISGLRRASAAAAGIPSTVTTTSASRGWGATVSEALIALACISFSWFLIHWSLLNLSLYY